MAKQCFFTENSLEHIDFKDVNILKKFLNPHGRILSRKRTNITAKNQRKLALAVKRSRYMALLPYVMG